jgi:hypothetical protein
VSEADDIRAEIEERAAAKRELEEAQKERIRRRHSIALHVARRLRRKSIYVLLDLTHPNVLRFIREIRFATPRNSNSRPLVGINQRRAIFQIKPTHGVHRVPWAKLAADPGTPVLGIGGVVWARTVIAENPVYWGAEHEGPPPIRLPEELR